MPMKMLRCGCSCMWMSNLAVKYISKLDIFKCVFGLILPASTFKTSAHDQRWST
jgi:hypothetical protein